MPNKTVKTMADKAGVSYEEAEKKWNEAKSKASEEGYKEGSVRFYKIVMTIFKNMIGK